MFYASISKRSTAKKIVICDTNPIIHGDEVTTERSDILGSSPVTSKTCALHASHGVPVSKGILIISAIFNLRLKI